MADLLFSLWIGINEFHENMDSIKHFTVMDKMSFMQVCNYNAPLFPFVLHK